MKAYITAEEYKRIYFEHGSINSIPDKVLVEVERAPEQGGVCECYPGHDRGAACICECHADLIDQLCKYIILS
ncbi:hypothetical protein LCGC14_1351100 [marine sediment metagenome]|uniref:Uncharacterized protein n=1 Tax=marine sediment metagenome TaxID=412755 RepID=A0A0F9ND70_9ZZZZ